MSMLLQTHTEAQRALNSDHARLVLDFACPGARPPSLQTRSQRNGVRLVDFVGFCLLRGSPSKGSRYLIPHRPLGPYGASCVAPATSPVATSTHQKSKLFALSCTTRPRLAISRSAARAALLGRTGGGTCSALLPRARGVRSGFCVIAAGLLAHSPNGPTASADVVALFGIKWKVTEENERLCDTALAHASRTWEALLDIYQPVPFSGHEVSTAASNLKQRKSRGKLLLALPALPPRASCPLDKSHPLPAWSPPSCAPWPPPHSPLADMRQAPGLLWQRTT